MWEICLLSLVVFRDGGAFRLAIHYFFIYYLIFILYCYHHYFIVVSP